MREDNEATEVMNSFSECLEACAILCRWPEKGGLPAGRDGADAT